MSYKRKQNEKKRLKKLYDETKGGYLCGAYYSYDKNRLIRYYKSNFNSSYKFFKKIYHKKLRHSETVNKKEYDLFWIF